MLATAPARDCDKAHVFYESNPLAERRTRLVVALTLVMMVVELLAGWLFNSMALLADGWHMSSHAIALGLSAAAYALARRYASDRRFAFGTWKIEVLGGYTSAVLLVGVVVYIAYESLTRLINPVAIGFNEAIGVACIGLVVNIVSAWLLAGAHQPQHQPHHHDHGHGHSHGHQDLNLRSAYIHVAADAVTSILAIAALTAGKFLNAVWFDPAVGIVGSIVIAVWAVSLLRDTGKILLDAEMDAPLVAEIRQAIEASAIPATIRDLHVWRVGRGSYACLLAISTPTTTSADAIRQILSVHEELVHVTIEVGAPESAAA